MNPQRAFMPRAIELKDGEVRDDVRIALWRGLAVEGRVLDEWGEPMANIEVFATRWDSAVSQQFGNSRTTDDRGVFRLFGLMPGQYRICADPRRTSAPVFGQNTTVADRPIKTCHPSAVVETDAQAVTLGTTDVSGVDIRVLRSRAFTVSGTVTDSSGTPVDRVQVSLVRVEGFGSASTGSEVRSGGQFIVRGVTPGEYAISAETGSRFNPDDKRERELAYVPIRVEGADLGGLVVATSKTATVVGRVVFEEGTPARFASGMRVNLRVDPTTTRRFMAGFLSAQVKEDLTFELAGLFGPQTVTITGQPREWVLKSVRYRGDDVSDMPVEFKSSSDPRLLEIVLTNRGAVVSGRMLDDSGKPVADCRIFLLSADPARRKVGSGIVTTGIPKPSDGSFRLSPVRAGEYMIVAVAADEVPPWLGNDPSSLERLAKVAERITLVENDQRTIDLRVARIQ
jgi:protocatechuate 3,4-dioxygenase beta subunit